ncbi:hypothetical protein D0Z00_002464 [Geotrichum galactomycetum]|uniref:Uncharacterized protein n=1 Tax=Geotrichum galactomycetum TaxID=27317 RepID=A0ACB6V410_9ASCO|nr:hypothetical protein D0Z00_002464 [Geotrichum candidum]
MSRYSDNGGSSLGGDYADRFRVDGDFPVTNPATRPSSRPTSAVLVSLIERACAPHLHEPNLALNLEIADIINQKKGTTPRIAAINIVKHINDKNSHVAILAIGILDICVKNCGYPFYLQISRKEFLNELVRRFPEKPPVHYTRVQSLILQQLQEWWETICCTSKYKEDLGYIRDMHRLLSFKGYVFPEISLSDAAVLNPTENFQSAAEMEKEEREAQEAKLQELIRRGTPADLQEANRLMKIMSGFQESFTNYKAKVAEEVDKLRRKSDLLEEMLSNVKEGDAIQDDDVYSDIVSTLKTSQPKIEKMIDEEKDDEEAVIKLLALNDRIQSLLQKYFLLKKKDYAAASTVKIEGGSAPAKPNASLSLIDFDDEPRQSTSSTSSPPPSGSGNINLLDQLNGLSFSPPAAKLTNHNITDLFSSPSPQPISAPAAASPATSGTDYSIFKSLSPPATSAVSSPALQHQDSEWGNFGTAPAPTQPASVTTHPINDDIHYTAVLTKTGASTLQIKSTFSASSGAVSGLNLQLSVPKSYHLTMDPQSGTTLMVPGAIVTQITNVSSTHGGAINGVFKFRFKVNATVNGVPYERQGMVSENI